ncbi:MAG: GntR family transcriptional regulator [Gallicola sp.]|uniref:GntR family transcriptional regulator n=1 Tax=Gallicola sp. Sow4_E12 TaxID=3438785 RepID=UPI00179D4049|nr:GntR family transcriptional regulator [Gallicola sp.]
MAEKNLRIKVYENIKKDLIRGKYNIYDRINEKELMAKYEVSKAPIRDALIELCNEGVLKSVPRYGYTIVQYSDEYLKSIIQFREVVEIEYLKKYWDRIQLEDIQNLEELHHSTTSDVDKSQIENYWKANQDFHLKLASFYHDEFFYETLKTAMTKQMIIFAQFYWNHWDKSVFNLYSHQHDSLIELLKNGDKEKAEKELKRDIQSFMQL